MAFFASNIRKRFSWFIVIAGFSAVDSLAFANFSHPVGASYKCQTVCHEAENIIKARNEKVKLSPCKECHAGVVAETPASPFISNASLSRIAARPDLEKKPGIEKKSAPPKSKIRKRESAGSPAPKPPPGMAYVPAGEFIMGSNTRWDDESPEYIESVEAFFIDIHETTNTDYKKFIDAAKRENPYHWPNGEIPKGKENHPVIYVSWFDAADYCQWAEKRLPTEEEWEKAARGVEGNVYPWGNVWDVGKSNNPYKHSTGTEPVGSYPEGKSPYGLYDMSGNVWEWVNSFYLPHPGNTVSRPEYGQKNRILKGGSWFDCLSYGCGLSAPAFNRSFFTPEVRNNSFGFRCAMSAVKKMTDASNGK